MKALNRKGALGGIIGVALTLMVLIIIIEAVVIPVNNDIFDKNMSVSQGQGGTGLNGTARTVVSYNGLMLATLIIVGIVGGMGSLLGGKQ